MNIQSFVQAAKPNQFFVSYHAEEQAKQRKISAEEIVACIQKGKLKRRTESNIGETVGFHLDGLVVVCGKHPNRPNQVVIVTVFYDDRVTGLVGGINPKHH